eukprot:3060376-Prymnesium_polylepis.5
MHAVRMYAKTPTRQIRANARRRCRNVTSITTAATIGIRGIHEATRVTSARVTMMATHVSKLTRCTLAVQSDPAKT